MADRLGAGAPDKSSNLTPETFLEMYGAWRSAKRVRGEASSEVMLIKKKMKGVGVDMRAFDLMEKLNDLDDDEAETVLKMVVRYGSWCGMGFAAKNTDLFQGMAIEKPSDDAAAEHRAARAKDDGYFAGRDGAKRDSCKHLPGTQEYAQWNVGWMEGQASIANRMGAASKKAAGSGSTTTGTPRPGRKKAAAPEAATPGGDGTAGDADTEDKSPSVH